MLFICIAAAAVALYAVFIVGPALVAQRFIFSRMRSVSLDDLSLVDNRYTPYLDEMKACRDRIASADRETVEIKAADGIALRASYVDLGSDRTVIFCHGYRADPMINFSLQGGFFLDLGYNLLIIDERGHGESEGNFVTLGLREGEDILAWAEYAASRNGVKSVAVWGISMGAFAVASVSDRFDPDSVRLLVVDCGFVSPKSQLALECRRRCLPGALMVPWIKLAARLRFGVDAGASAKDALSRASIPVFFLHGSGDRTVPLSEGKENFAATASRKKLFVTEGAEHTLAFPAGGDRVKEALLSFMNDVTDQKDNTADTAGGNDEKI